MQAANSFSPLHNTTYSRQVLTCVYTYHTSQQPDCPHSILPVRQQPSRRSYPLTTQTQVQPVHLAILTAAWTHFNLVGFIAIPIPRGCSFPILRLLRHLPSTCLPRHDLSPLPTNNDRPPTSLFQLSNYLHTSLFVTGDSTCADFSLPVHLPMPNCSSTCLHAYTFTLALIYQTQHPHPCFRLITTRLHFSYIPYF
jgi:hypothetical protein